MHHVKAAVLGAWLLTATSAVSALQINNQTGVDVGFAVLNRDCAYVLYSDIVEPHSTGTYGGLIEILPYPRPAQYVCVLLGSESGIKILGPNPISNLLTATCSIDIFPVSDGTITATSRCHAL